MRLVVLILVSIAAYAITLGVLDRLLHVGSESQLYWLCFVASGLVLAVGLFNGFRRARTSWFIVAATSFACVLLVAAGDIALAVAYSCSQGVCL